MPAKGRIQVPNPVTEDVLRVIAQMSDQEIFTIQDIVSRVGRPAYQVNHALINKTNQGSLERISWGKYRKGGTRINSCIPHGVIVEAVFMVLFTTPSDELPLRSMVIAGEVETITSREVPPTSVLGILTRWHRRGHLERTGRRGEYAYRLRDGVTERPFYNKYD